MLGRLCSLYESVAIRTEVVGAENLLRQGPAVIIANHTSMIDPIMLLGLLGRLGLHAGPKLRFVASEIVFNSSLTRGLVQGAGMIPAGFRRASPESVRPVMAALEREEMVLLYPEGDVQATGEGAPRKFRPGIAWVLEKIAVPVIPLAHHDARLVSDGRAPQVALRGVTAILRRPRWSVVIGKPIQPSEWAPAERERILNVLSERLNSVWLQAKELAGEPLN
jgi:1-acyl-sn-glycerol-3-phosphate acyltransferase